MQLRRVLLLFALVLGLSALVASIAPPPEEDDEGRPADTTAVTRSSPPPPRVDLTLRRGTRRVEEGSSFWLKVPVSEPGDVVLRHLGLRQSADPRTPAQFALLASPPGRYAVAFAPPLGRSRVIGHLAFVEPTTVKPRRRGR